MPDDPGLDSRPKIVPQADVTTDVALSYGNAQLVLTLLLSNALRDRGLSSTWDESRREGTISEIMERVVGPIVRESRCLVAIVTAESVLSEFFVLELSLCDDYNKPIVVWQPGGAAFDDRPQLATLSKPEYLRIAEEIAPQVFAMLGVEPPSPEDYAESVRKRVLEVKRRLTSHNVMAILTQHEDDVASVAEYLEPFVAELRLLQQREIPITGRHARVAMAGKAVTGPRGSAAPEGSRRARIKHANGLGNRGYALQRRGQLAEAWALHLEALAVHRQTGSRLGEAIDLGNFGTIECEQGDFEAGRGHFRQALEIHQALGNREGVADQMSNVAIVEKEPGRLDAALASHETALAMYRELGSERAIAAQFANIGNVLQLMKRPDEAVERQEAALALYTKLGDSYGQARSLGNLGMIAEERNRFDEALSYFLAALPLSRGIADRHNECNALLCVGRVLGAQGDWSGARDHFTQAAQLAHLGGFHSLAAAAQTCLRKMEETKAGAPPA